MLRSAAKNHASVTVVVDAADYERVLAAMTEESALLKLRRELALKVFRTHLWCDCEILKVRSEEPDLHGDLGIPSELDIQLPKARYFAMASTSRRRSLETFVADQLQGKELSFNNIIDITAATYLIGGLKPTVAILKPRTLVGGLG